MKPQKQYQKDTKSNAVGKNMLPLAKKRVKKCALSYFFLYKKNIFPLFNYIKKIKPPVQKLAICF